MHTTKNEEGHIYAYCDTCRRWVRVEDGARSPDGRWACWSCRSVVLTWRARRELEAQRHAAQ